MDKKYNRGFTLAEIIVATAISVILFVSSIGAYLFMKTTLYGKFVEYDLTRDVNMALKRITTGVNEGSVLYGLRSASKFTITNVSAISYVGSDNNIRQYYLNGSSLVYSSPAQSPGQRTVYTAPSGSTFTLRFWEPGGYLGHETVGIYIGVSQPVGGKTVSGSVSTYVNIRNLSK